MDTESSLASSSAPSSSSQSSSAPSPLASSSASSPSSSRKSTKTLGRGAGTKNYSRDELNCLLEIVAENREWFYGRDGWDLITNRFNQVMSSRNSHHLPRDRESLHKRWFKIEKDRQSIPTGNPEKPEYLDRYREIDNDLNKNRSISIIGGEEDDEEAAEGQVRDATGYDSPLISPQETDGLRLASQDSFPAGDLPSSRASSSLSSPDQSSSMNNRFNNMNIHSRSSSSASLSSMTSAAASSISSSSRVETAASSKRRRIETQITDLMESTVRDRAEEKQARDLLYQLHFDDRERQRKHEERLQIREDRRLEIEQQDKQRQRQHELMIAQLYAQVATALLGRKTDTTNILHDTDHTE
jgi:hypothetical protein